MADVSVRPALGSEAGEVARVQRASWGRAGAASVIPSSVLDRLVSDEVVAAWEAAIEHPPTPLHHVLVALEREWIVGMAAFGPAEVVPAHRENGVAADSAYDGVGDSDSDINGDEDDGPTGEIAALLVEPRWGRRGHGSRLLAATVDLARSDGMASLIIWLPESDVTARGLFAAAGWADAGWIRTLDADGTPLREVCMHTSVLDEDVFPLPSDLAAEPDPVDRP